MKLLFSYLSEVRAIRATGSAVAETSYYPALVNLLNGVGAGLKPRVRCHSHVSNTGAGIPDAGFFTSEQFARQDHDTPLSHTMARQGSRAGVGASRKQRLHRQRRSTLCQRGGSENRGTAAANARAG
jgi:hypothetical protein